MKYKGLLTFLLCCCAVSANADPFIYTWASYFKAAPKAVALNFTGRVGIEFPQNWGFNGGRGYVSNVPLDLGGFIFDGNSIGSIEETYLIDSPSILGAGTTLLGGRYTLRIDPPTHTTSLGFNLGLTTNQEGNNRNIRVSVLTKDNNTYSHTYTFPGLGAQFVGFHNSSEITRILLTTDYTGLGGFIALNDLAFENSSIESLTWINKPAQAVPSVRPRTYVLNGVTHNYSLAPYIVKPQKCKVRALEGGIPAKNAKVILHIYGDNSTTGHDHVNGSASQIHGWVTPCDSSYSSQVLDDKWKPIDTKTNVLQADRGGSVINGPISATHPNTEEPLLTDADGYAYFLYTPGEVASNEEITLQFFGKPDTMISQKFSVGIPGLEDLGNPPGILPVGSLTNRHSKNHFGTRGTIAGLKRAAALFQTYQNEITPGTGDDPRVAPLVTKLQKALAVLSKLKYSGSVCSQTPVLMPVNDLSLEYGGLFDVNCDWGAPHGGHRSGNNSDLGIGTFMTTVPSDLFTYDQLDFWSARGIDSSGTDLNIAIKSVNLLRAQMMVLACSVSGALTVRGEGKSSIANGTVCHVTW